MTFTDGSRMTVEKEERQSNIGVADCRRIISNILDVQNANNTADKKTTIQKEKKAKRIRKRNRIARTETDLALRGTISFVRKLASLLEATD